MKYELSNTELKFLRGLVKRLTKDDARKLDAILQKFDHCEAKYKALIEKSSSKIKEIRKEDPLYARSSTLVENHFKALVRKIKSAIKKGDFDTARELYKKLLHETRFPRYSQNLYDALNELTEFELKVVKG